MNAVVLFFFCVLLGFASSIDAMSGGSCSSVCQAKQSSPRSTSSCGNTYSIPEDTGVRLQFNANTATSTLQIYWGFTTYTVSSQRLTGWIEDGQFCYLSNTYKSGTCYMSTMNELSTPSAAVLVFCESTSSYANNCAAQIYTDAYSVDHGSTTSINVAGVSRINDSSSRYQSSTSCYGSLSAGAVVGISLGILFLVLFSMSIIICCVVQRRRRAARLAGLYGPKPLVPLNGPGVVITTAPMSPYTPQGGNGAFQTPVYPIQQLYVPPNGPQIYQQQQQQQAFITENEAPPMYSAMPPSPTYHSYVQPGESVSASYPQPSGGSGNANALPSADGPTRYEPSAPMLSETLDNTQYASQAATGDYVAVNSHQANR